MPPAARLGAAALRDGDAGDDHGFHGASLPLSLDARDDGSGGGGGGLPGSRISPTDGSAGGSSASSTSGAQPTPQVSAKPGLGTNNYIGMLNEVCQMRRLPVPRYSEPSRVAGADHSPLFLVKVKMHSPDFSVLYEGEGRDATVKLAKHAAARRVLEQLGTAPHLFERSPPKLLPGWRLPDHVQPPLAAAGRVVFIDLQNQQTAVRTFLARPTDFVVGFVSARGALAVPFSEAPWPIMVVHSQARDAVHASMCWELCKVLMGDGRRPPPPALPLDVVIVSRDLFSEAIRDVVRLDPDTARRTRVLHVEDSADVPL